MTNPSSAPASSPSDGAGEPVGDARSLSSDASSTGGSSGNGGLRALAQGVSVGFGGVEPKDLGQLMDFAQVMAKAGPMVGKAFRGKSPECLAITMQAMRWGMDPFAVSQKAYVTGETIAYEAQLVNAVILRHAPLKGRPTYLYEGEGANRRCKVVALLKGDSEPKDYLSPPLASVKKNSPLWKDDPDQQLGYYAIRAWVRRHCPDVLLGVYAVDEMETVDGEYERVAEPVEADARAWAKASGPEIKQLHEDLETATSHAELDGRISDFCERFRCSENVWTGIEELKARAHDRIEEANAQVGNEEMDQTYADTVRE